jgi:hypothetical protein
MRQQRAIIVWLLLAMAPWFAASGSRAECSARSGGATAVLVELYLPTGCADCARAERWLEGLGEIAVTLPAGSAEHLSKRKLLVRQRMALTPRPYVLVQGEEFPRWDKPDYEDAAERIRATPARAHLELSIVRIGDAALEVDVHASGAGELYVAAYRGKRILDWEGPFDVRPGRLSLALPPGSAAAATGVVAFVQDPRTRAVLQALRRPAC